MNKLKIASSAEREIAMGSCWSCCCGDDEDKEEIQPLVPRNSPHSTPPRIPSLRRPVVVHDQVEQVSDVAGAPVDKRWYHGRISDEQASNRLLYVDPPPENGSYLVYDDPRHRERYILMAYKNGEVHKWSILRRRNGMYILGEDRPGAVEHDSVRKLIRHHRGLRGKPIKLEDGGVLTLTKSYVYVDEK